MAKRERVIDFVIDNAAAADFTPTGLGAPGVGKFIRVLGFTIVAGGAVNVTFKSGATAKTGALPCAANTGVSPSVGSPDAGARQFDLAENQALVITPSAAVQVSGWGTAQILKVGTAE